jgi:hypothetical protein
VAALVTAVRLGMAGHRVLIAEEEAARRAFPGLREPFFLSGSRDGGALDACLRELAIPLIDRRRVLPQPLAVQLVGPEYRIDLGEPELSTSELVSWGVCKPDQARALLHDLREASEAEREAMLSAPLVRVGRSLARARGRAHGSGVRARGLPREAAVPDDALGPVLEAQVRALSNLAERDPSPEARARLLGSILAGGAGFEDGEPWLVGLLRRRAEAVYAEFRSLKGGFRLVIADGQPGIEQGESGELWLGRALAVAATSAGLAGVIDPADRPDFIRDAPRRRRLAFHLRARRSVMPEAMGPRVISLGAPPEGRDGWRLITLASFADRQDPDWVSLVAATVSGPEEDPGEVQSAVLERVRGLLPFAAGDLVSRPMSLPRWDDDGWLEDPPAGAGWPGDVDLRVSGRPPVYRLDRSSVAGLGLEGDLLLGWRGGDAIAAELG